jgi:hypothetical protein
MMTITFAFQPPRRQSAGLIANFQWSPALTLPVQFNPVAARDD